MPVNQCFDSYQRCKSTKLFCECLKKNSAPSPGRAEITLWGMIRIFLIRIIKFAFFFISESLYLRLWHEHKYKWRRLEFHQWYIIFQAITRQHRRRWVHSYAYYLYDGIADFGGETNVLEVHSIHSLKCRNWCIYLIVLSAFLLLQQGDGWYFQPHALRSEYVYCSGRIFKITV